MAKENKVLLNGLIENIEDIHEEGVIQVDLYIKTLRRRELIRNKIPDPDIIKVSVTDEQQISYLIKNRIQIGDMIEVFGVFCTLRSNKESICPACNALNVKKGESSFIHPLFIRKFQIKPDKAEIVTLSVQEYDLDEITKSELLYEKKSFPGTIIESKDLGVKDGLHSMMVVSREPITKDEIKTWMEDFDEYVNRVFFTGNLGLDPTFNENEEGGRVCSYVMGIGRKVFIPEDDADNKTDFIWAKSLGTQAETDKKHIQKRSLVSLDGTLQSRKFKSNRECSCGNKYTWDDSAMEVIPFTVEYDEKCSINTREDKNLVILNGRVVQISYGKDENGEVVQANIGVEIIERFSRNTRPTVNVVIRDTDMICYLKRLPLFQNDMIEIYGSFCTFNIAKEWKCQGCDTPNNYIASIPIVFGHRIKVFPLNVKCYERIILSKDERKNNPISEVQKLIYQKKKSPYTIIYMGDEKRGKKDLFYPIKVVSQKDTPDEDVLSWLNWSNEIGNRILLSGNVIAEPDFFTDGKHICMYEVESKRIVMVPETDMIKKAGSFFICSEDEQADLDHKALKTGSRVIIDGRFREKRRLITCPCCEKSTTLVNGELEIIPYYVGYLNGVEQISDVDDNYEDDDLDPFMPIEDIKEDDEDDLSGLDLFQFLGEE